MDSEASFVTPWVLRSILLIATTFCHPLIAHGQDTESAIPSENGSENLNLALPEKVEVEPLAQDKEIADRLENILEATSWFEQAQVRVEHGVVFLEGLAENENHVQWATRLAGNTQDVVAVVNHMVVKEKSMWDLSTAWGEIRHLGSEFVRSSPLIGIGILLLLATWFATRWSVRGTASLLSDKLKSQLLRDVASRAVAIPVFLLGLYLVLKVTGLTRLAMTVVGGTGLMGLVLGFAFRDIAENFLASVLLSIQHPFASGDLIEVAGHRGYVQSVNARSTLLMTLEGNHVQIPNATVYKETITNFTANPNARFDFTVGIGYEDSASEAQSVILKVLHDHPAVVDDPESLVLVEQLGTSTVNLRIYFWVDIARYSPYKVQSAVVRLTKRALEQAGISMPDEAREVVFPAGVPVEMVAEVPIEPTPEPLSTLDTEADSQQSNSAEGNLESEAREIQQQARQSRQPEAGQDLLQH